jgi:adenosine deaminase
MPEKLPAYRRPIAFYQSLPKVDMHRHLEGSLRLETMAEVARAHGMDFMGTNRLRNMVQVHESDPFTFQNFLSKFETLRLFYRSPEVITRITREAIQDAAADNIRYCELRFTPKALSVAQGFNYDEVMDWVADAAQKASAEVGIQTRLIASFNRHESLEIAEQVTRLAAERIPKGIIGIDLAGNEAQFSGLPFAGLFKEARQAGLHVTVHAGEWGGAANVSDAILSLGAERIGHGVRVLEDDYVTQLAADRGIAFEVCVTSNYQSGVVPSLRDHPFSHMLTAGLNVTVNTDDPSISQIRLSDEYCKVCENLGVGLYILRMRVIAASRAAFLSSAERQALAARLEAEFPAS